MSSNKNKKYWKNLAELNPVNNIALESLGQKEFIEEIPVDEFLGDDKNLSNSSSISLSSFIKGSIIFINNSIFFPIFLFL